MVGARGENWSVADEQSSYEVFCRGAGQIALRGYPVSHADEPGEDL